MVKSFENLAEQDKGKAIDAMLNATQKQVERHKFFLATLANNLGAKGFKTLIEKSFGKRGKFSNELITAEHTAIELYADYADVQYFLFDYGKEIMSAYHSVYTNELSAKENLTGLQSPVIAVQEGSESCKTIEDTTVAKVLSAVLEPNVWENQWAQCYKNFLGTEFHYLVNANLLNSTQFMRMYQTLFADLLFREMLRVLWFGGMTLTTVSPNTGEWIGPVQSYFTHNTAQGLWVKIESDATIPYISIAAYNAGATYAAQTMTTTDAYQLMVDMLSKLDATTRASGEAELHISTYIWNVLVTAAAEPTNTRSGLIQYNASTKEMYFADLRVVNRVDWTFAINKFMNDGTKFMMPNRALIYEKRNIEIGWNEASAKSTWGDAPYFDYLTQNVVSRGTLIIDGTYLNNLTMVKAY